jgi:ATP-dependent protease HslVU (ClpYQ) peptidase subunit
LTCVVAIAKDGIVYIGADSCGSTATSAMVVTNPKVFLVDNRFIIGVCASFRAIDLLNYSLKVPKQASSVSDDAFMRTVFISAVRETFIKNGFPREDDIDDVNFLVGYRGRVFCVEDDYSIINPVAWGHAIGSGAEAARGSLWTTKDAPDVEARIMIALEASEAMTPSVRGPFLLEKLPKAKPQKQKEVMGSPNSTYEVLSESKEV